MACTVEIIEFVCMQLAEAGEVRSRKMFGDYMIYVNEKPVVLACDNIAYVKVHPAIADLMTDAEKGFPYEGCCYRQRTRPNNIFMSNNIERHYVF